MKLIKVCCIALTMLSVTSVEAEIYKWMDDEGRTHYSQTPPPKYDSETLNITIGKPSQPHQGGKFSGGFSKLVRNATGSPKSGVNKTTILDCRKAVENSMHSIENMLDDGKKKTKNGQVTMEDYARISNNLKIVEKKLSVSKCESAKGPTKEFYRCMSDGFNHIAHCGKKHNIMFSE